MEQKLFRNCYYHRSRQAGYAFFLTQLCARRAHKAADYTNDHYPGHAECRARARSVDGFAIKI